MRSPHRRYPLIAIAVAIAAAGSYVAFWPVPIDPVAWSPPPAPSWTGALAPHRGFAGLARLCEARCPGSEDVAVTAAGDLFAGTADGRIVRVDSRARGGGGEGGERTIARTGGRPLGLALDPTGALLVADAYRGLLRILPDTGELTVLATAADGQKFGFTDDLDIARDGTVYFSDASFKYHQKEYELDILESRANGRLLSYDPRDRVLRVVERSLYFANGVALGPGDTFVLVAETTRYRLLRRWLKGARAGELEVFADNLPGFPDGVSFNGRDGFWVALFTRRNATLDALLPHPALRKVLLRLPAALTPEPDHYGLALKLDLDGRTVTSLHAATSSAYAPITNAVEHGDFLYLASLHDHGIARMPLPADLRAAAGGPLRPSPRPR